MNRVVLLLYVVILFLYTVSFDADRYVQETAHNRVKAAINRGAHDASLQVEADMLGEGKIIFSRTRALAAFEAGVRDNLQLDARMNPHPGTLFNKPMEVIFEDYVDHSDTSIVFPYMYSRPERNIQKLMKGPGVVYQVRIRLPATNYYSYTDYIYKSVVFEYPL